MFVSVLITILFLSLPCQAQRLDEEGTRVLSYIQKAMNFNRTTPQEKVYLHFDNTGYFENETMWWKAYVTRTDNRKATDLSKVLYVELLNPSGDVLKTTKWPIDSLGQANGDMKLDTLFGSGFYEVRAYTRYMTNWGVNACFSRVFPIFKAPKQEGDYHDLTINTRLYKYRDPNNRDRNDSLYLKAMDEGLNATQLMKTISVQFYPEGGDMVVGKKCRVAMLAVDDNGNPYEGTGFVMNSVGDVITRVATDSLGRGMFEITPDSSRLTMQMRNAKKSIKRSVQTFVLPVARMDGVALSLDAVSDDMVVTLQSSESMYGKRMGYVVMNNGNITYCDTVVAQPLIEIELDRDKQHEGVNQFTLFDADGRILAERFFFICPGTAKDDSIYFSSETKRLKPCGRVSLDVKALPNSTISFSAIDAHNMINGREGNMKTWMLLSSDVKGYIHNADYYLEADDAEHRRSADLLMLTQGWRRYDWELMAGRETFEKVQPIEDKFYLFGKLNEYRKRNKRSNVEVEAYLYNRSGESLSGRTKTDQDGNYAFELPFLDGEWKMQIYTKIKNEKKTFYVGIDRLFSPIPRYITPLEAKVIHPLAPNMFVKNQHEETEEEEVFIPITEKNHVLQNVTVKAKRRYFTNDDWMYKNENFGRHHASLYYNIDVEREAMLDRGEPEMDIFEWLCRKNAMFNNPKCIDLPIPVPQEEGNPDNAKTRWHGRMSYNNSPILWIVNNGETMSAGAYTDNFKAVGDPFFPLFLDEIKSVYIAPHEGVRIYIYTHMKYPSASNKGLRRTYFQGFNKPSTFKMEDYSVLPPMADFRRTIYWNPNVRTDSEGKAKIEFYNNSTCEEMYISAEGMSDDGRVIVNE